MKDEELKITKERVLSAAGKCGTAKEVLKELFPEAFGDEWEDVTNRMFIDQGAWLSLRGSGCIGESPFSIIVNYDSNYANRYKIERGKIWRKKS
jgi:hypothetical protein